MNQVNEHHLVLGELQDILTGQVLPDTHDERYRQTIARLLLTDKGYEKKHLQSRINHTLIAGKQSARMKIDFLIKYKEKVVAIIKYAPGSLVTRRLSTLALSRTITGYQIPIVVVTNGENAEIIDGETGNLIADGLDNIPSFSTIEKQFSAFSFKKISEPVCNQASRIAFACEIDGACPCDTDICVLENDS